VTLPTAKTATFTFTIRQPLRTYIITADGDVALAGSETVLLDLDALSSATNHNGGALHYVGNKLFVGVGENANSALAQSLSSPLGKMLRINSDGSIPSDNPFFGTTSGINRAIWALGLRNPFTFAVNASGRVFINDVGQNTWEEINNGIPGANYGWPGVEGTGANALYTNPLFSYKHIGGVCAISGGAFYSPVFPSFPSAYRNGYFFGDYCGGWVNFLNQSGATTTMSSFASGINAPVDLRVSDRGDLYILARGTSSSNGYMRVISYQPNPNAPSITQQPASASASAGSAISFEVTVRGAAPFSYRWQRNDQYIPDATSRVYTITRVSSTDNGATFRCVVSNSFGSTTSLRATLIVVVGNTPPSVVILAPALGTSYAGGNRISYRASATDDQETLSSSRYSWEIVFRHDFHVHPFLSGLVGKEGTFVVANTGETSVNVSYELKLTVTDSGGLSSTARRIIAPKTVVLTLKASRSGPNQVFTVDGTPCPANPSCIFRSVVGMQRTIRAPATVTVGAKAYSFQSWSDKGSISHVITAPASATTFTAKY
jgi:hypothetical protein